MQSFDTKTDLPSGTCISLELPDGNELAVYNVDGEFYATENFCPHKGARLTEGTLCGHIIECGLHGWQFDVRSGECLTVPDRIRTYPVTIEDGVIKVHLATDNAD
jgi:naphthalene 1,2-dioxygenase ferredoxin component